MIHRYAWCVAALVGLGLLAGCGSDGDGNGGGGGGGGGTRTASIDGFIVRPSSDEPTRPMPIPPGVRVEALALTTSGPTFSAETLTDDRGRYAFAPERGTGVRANASLLIRLRNSTRFLTALVNSANAGVVGKNLNVTTHVAAQALLADRPNVVRLDDGTIQRYENAAQQVIDDAVADNPDVDLSDPDQATALAAVVARTRSLIAGNGAFDNTPPTLDEVVVTPLQVGPSGGEVTLSARVLDDDNDSVDLAVFAVDRGVSQPVTLTRDGDSFTGTFTIPANSGAAGRVIDFVFVPRDGQSAEVSTTVRSVTVLPDGQVTLDILVETLFDEDPSRAPQARDEAWWAARMDRLRPRLRRGSATRVSRQVNENQTIRGAELVFDDQPSINGRTGNDGLLLLDVPLSAADDGLLSVTARIGRRAPYRQVLVLPEAGLLRNGDTIEIDLVLAPAADWQELADFRRLGELDFDDRMPLMSLFNVLNDIRFINVQPEIRRFLPLSDSERGDDGDVVASNLPPGLVSLEGTFANPDNPLDTSPFGPVAIDLDAGIVHAVSSLLPPEAL